MARKRSTAARKRVKPATHWRMYLLASVLLVAVLGATGIAAQLPAALASPDSTAAAAASTASQAANVTGASNAAGASSSTRTLYVYGDQLRPLVEETDGVQTLNIYGPGGQIIAQVVRDGQGNEEVRYLLADHLGSTRAALDGDGNAVARFEYGPYGETTAAGTAAAEVRYRYTGHPWDEAQGVYETPARQYDPTLGRFLSVDPQRADASPYVYGGNNPVGYVDPTGGGKVPYATKSGFGKTNYHNQVAKSLGEALGMAREQQMMDATKVFGKPGVIKSDYQRGNMRKFLYGDKEDRTYKYNDKVFWIVGGDDVVDPPGSIATKISAVQDVDSNFGKSIVVIDVSTNHEASGRIALKLDSIKVPFKVIRGEYTSGHGENGNGTAITLTIKDNGVTYNLQHDPELKRLRAYVNSVAEFAAMETNGRRQIGSIVPPGHTVGESSGAGTSGDSSREFFHQGELMQFPSVPPAGAGVQGQGQVLPAGAGVEGQGQVDQILNSGLTPAEVQIIDSIPDLPL